MISGDLQERKFDQGPREMQAVLLYVYFPAAAVTNSHKLNDLKQYKLLFYSSRRSEVQASS